MAAKKMNINVVFGKKTDSFSCSSRREFWTKVRSHYRLDAAEIQLFDISSNTRKKITINDLQDKMKVELKVMCSIPSSINGERKEIETPIKVPNKDDLMEKFKENRVLNGLERQFLIKVVEDFYDNGLTFKRKSTDVGVPTVNKKVQVGVDHLRQSISTQTDSVARDVQNKPSTSRQSRDIHTESKRLALADKKDPNKVRSLMDETYDARRQFIYLERPVLLLIREKYPLLFNSTEVRNEMDRIFYFGKAEEFLKNVDKFSNSILSLVDEDDEMLNTIKDKIKGCLTPTQKKYAKEVGALLILSNLLHEKRVFLNTEDESFPKSYHPFIEAPCRVSKLFYDNHIFRIVAEGITVCEASNFLEAILCLMGCYFIFNIVYPEKVYNTLVVMEKVFLEANDTDINDIDDQTKQIIRLIQLKTNVKPFN